MRRSMQALGRDIIARIAGGPKRETYRRTRAIYSISSACANVEGSGLMKLGIMSSAEIARVEEDAPHSTRLLIAYIQQHYYELHRSDLSELLRLVDCAAASPVSSSPLADNVKFIIAQLGSALHTHMEQAQNALFPMAVEGETVSLIPAVDSAICRNILQLDLLERLQDLTVGCMSDLVAEPVWGALAFGSKEFCEGVASRVHLENEVLFPRLLAG